MNQSRTRRFLIAALVVPLLGLSYLSQRSLLQDRERLELTSAQPLDNAPPALAFTTVALGGFRGIVANALWIRLSDMQEDEKFFELIQLADWITKLQPRFAKVWSFQAWNLAYNVSVKFPDPESRWKWVREGITLLRDQGLVYNPKAAHLYHQLAYTFQHKLADNQDSAHRHYKASWKKEMEDLFGGEEPDWDELLNPSSPESAERLKRLREVYRLDPEAMRLVDEKYGPLEWRLPESQAIYWASYALERFHSARRIDLRRVIYQSLQTAVHRGRIIDYPEMDSFDLAPHPKLIGKANDAYEEMRRQDNALKQNIGDAHKNFLLYAITLLDGSAQKEEAHRWFKYMVTNYPDAMAEYESYEQMIHKRLIELALQGGPDRAPVVLRAFATQYFNYLAAEEGDLATLARDKALAVRAAYYRRYQMADQDRISIPTWEQVKRDVFKTRTENPPPIGYPDLLAAKLCALLGEPYPAMARAKNTPAPIIPPEVKFKTGTPEQNQEAGLRFLAEVSKRKGIQKLPSGLMWQIERTGQGKTPTPGSTIRAHLVGKLWNGDEVESTYETKHGTPMVFKLSLRRPGVQEALVRMKEGGKRRLYLPAELAYGKTGRPPSIPPNAAMIYDVELVEVLD